MRFRCARCGEWNHVVHTEVQLTARQQAIVEAVLMLSRHSPRRTASTRAVAARVGWSERMVRHELSVLEQMGEVTRPAGSKSGWAIATVPVVAAAQIAVS